METVAPEQNRLLGTSNTTLDDAIRSAIGMDKPLERDVLGRYDVVAVRGVVKGRTISFWQVVLKPKYTAV